MTSKRKIVIRGTIHAESGKIQNALFSGFLFIALFILISGCTSTYNYPSYLRHYMEYSPATYNGEWLYGLLQDVFKTLGLEYKYLVFFLYLICLPLSFKTAKRYLSDYSWMYCLLFLLYPLGASISAFRNGIAMLLLTYAFPCLCSKKKKDIFKFIIVIILAAGIQRTAYLYLLLLLKYPYEKRHSIKRWLLTLIYVTIIALAVAIAFFPPLMNIVRPVLATMIEDNDTTSKYIVYINKVANYGFVLYALVQLLFIFTLRKIRSIYEKDILIRTVDIQIQEDSCYSLASTVLFANTSLLFMIAFYKLNSNFFRIFYNLVPINYIALLALIIRIQDYQNRKTARVVFFVFFVFLSVYAVYYIIPWFNYNIVTMFTDNWILELFSFS